MSQVFHDMNFRTMPPKNTSRDAVPFCYHGSLAIAYHVRVSGTSARSTALGLRGEQERT